MVTDQALWRPRLLRPGFQIAGLDFAALPIRFGSLIGKPLLLESSLVRTKCIGKRVSQARARRGVDSWSAWTIYCKLPHQSTPCIVTRPASKQFPPSQRPNLMLLMELNDDRRLDHVLMSCLHDRIIRYKYYFPSFCPLHFCSALSQTTSISQSFIPYTSTSHNVVL